ncbi:dgt6 [Drosophila busckii]|uniref:Dgt6 n=1 Tax=Drosophila busckii TaxID=30019 RepID=A0A0M4ETX0_DROBS|nr:augmin complex subunit dgt6 [Drosophila busckii]ALC46405.1 dgt6 [Drosophila busckii]
MDRTMIAPWKAEEKEQSEKLHKKLQGLSLLYTMSDEMLKVFTWDMFLKPNQTAFFQVMHYLFRILDPPEFKRRFFWPITDKKSEANFRSSTVEYLKHLNEKHKLQWTNIKSYLVVMPGGMKFINFVLDLVTFVVQELTKQREKVLLAEGYDLAGLRNLSVKQMHEQSSFMKEYASAYIEQLEQHSAILREGKNKISQKYNEIGAATGIEVSTLLDDQFIDALAAHNRMLCEEKITAPAARYALLEAPLTALAEAMEQFQAKRLEHKHSNEAADKTLQGMQKLFNVDVAPSSGNSNTVRINAMLNVFNNISEAVAEQLDANDHHTESNEFITADLKDIHTALQQLEQQVNGLVKNLNTRAKGHSSNISGNATSSDMLTPNTPLRALDNINNTLLMKFVSTPPIKPEMLSAVSGGQVRLPLQDDFTAKQFENLLAPRSARKPKPQQLQLEHDTDLNNTLNRSKRIDPMQLLRTINKKSTKTKESSQMNLSSLGSKWKKMQATFGLDEQPPAVPTTPQAEAAKTPLSCSDCTLVERLPADSSGNSLIAKKSTAMLKVLDASLNVQNLSTSPSGRLDALVARGSPATPRLLINDQTFDDSQVLQSSRENADDDLLTKLSKKFELDFKLDNDDELQNISDSVLNDISI